MPFNVKRRILNILAVVLAAALLLFRRFFVETALGAFCLIVFIIVYFILTLRWWRCPHCDSYLRKLSLFASYCPYCGNKLE